MSKISELGPIKGANTRSEDLFVIVNLIQGDDGTKNITRKELVAAIQYEIFDRITITGGNISGVRIFNSVIEDNTMNRNIFNVGQIYTSQIYTSEIVGGSMVGTAVANVTIDGSDFSNGTGNNNVFTNTIVDFGALNNSTGNNNIFTNSTIDDSFYNNVTIEGGTANNLILTNITIDELILEDAYISNSQIDSTSFANGTIADSGVSNVDITDSEISNSNIRDTDLDNVDITNSRFSNGEIWNTVLSNNEIITTNIIDSTFSNGQIWDTAVSNSNITNSDFSDGTGNNNVFTNPTLENATMTGAMNNVIAQNIQISSSSSDGLTQQRSTIENSDIKESVIANSTIEESQLVDFDMNLTKVFEPMLDEDSYFALKNVKTGDTERMSYRQLYDEFSKKTEKSLKVHVASDGDDAYDGSILKPVRTLKRAEELCLEKAGGSYDRNDINNAVHISVGPGTYFVDEPIKLPDDCSMTSTAGQYATVIQKKKGWERTNGILVGSGNYVQGFGYMNFEVDNFDQPEGGFAIAYRPGALLRRSPYLRDSTQLSNFNRLDIEPPLNPFNSKGTILDLGQEFYLVAGHSPQSQFEVDDEVTFSSGATGYISYIADIDSARQIYVRNLKGNVEVGDILYAQRGGTGTVESIGIDDFPNRLVGRGGGCLLADRAVLDTDSLYTYVLCFGFTPRTQNGTGYVAKNGAGVNGIGSLSIFTRQAFFALDGGQMTLNNSGSQFGDISMRARGSTVIIRPAEANTLELIANSTFADTLGERKDDIIDNMIEYLTANTTAGGLGYQGYNADKCFRDTGIIVDNTGYDIATNSNYWGRLTGITYRSPISYVVVNEQLTETVGSIEHLKDDITAIFENASSEVLDRVNRSLDETLNVLQNGEEFANPIIFTNTGNGSAVAAREVVQDNRDLIIQQFVDWMDNNKEFYAYDSAKCQRDVKEYILPAVKYDTLLDTNYNSVTSGYAYYFKATKNVIGAQREETIAAYERLRKSTDDLTQDSSPLFAAEAYEKFNEIIDILKNAGAKYTPTNAAYTPTTGEFVITIADHGLEVGRYILLQPESFTFSCDTDGNVLQYSHPNASDPQFKMAMPIVSVTNDTITLNVGSTGYAGVHTLVKIKDDAVAVLGSAIEFSDDANISADKRNARKQLQANREFIQNYMMNWADAEWFFYNSDKCSRDMKQYIVPAVLRDTQTGTNFNSIQAGIAYRQAITKVAVNEQLTETVGAVEHLKRETVATVSDPIVANSIAKGYEEIIGIMQTGGREFTPTDATYNPATGDSILTLTNHNFEVGDQIVLAENALTFSCANTATSIVTEISHPRATDPAFNSPVTITAKTAETITVNVGNANGYVEPHTFVRAKLNGVKEYGYYNGSFTPTNATYDPLTGISEITIGAHDFQLGETIKIAQEGLTFECGAPAVQISHPRITDPSFNAALPIIAKTATTITVNVGSANGYTGAHTFVSAKTDAVSKVEVYNGKFTPTVATYDPINGDMTVTIGLHNLPVGKWIEVADESITFSCANTVTAVVTEISHPRSGDPAHKTPVRITGITGTTISFNVGNAKGYVEDHTFVSAAVDAINANAIYWTDPAKIDTFHTPLDVTYDPTTGVSIVELGAGHGITTDDHIEFKPQSIVFSCANTATTVVTEISNPRIGEPNYQMPLEVSAANTTHITVTSSAANGYTGAHTFVSAEVGSLIKTPANVTRQGKLAAKQLQSNRLFIQDEVDAWIRDNYFVYNDALCARDTGLILDAVRRDIATNSNLNSVFAGLSYRSGNASTESVIANELTETVGAINWLKDQIATNIVNGVGETRSNAAFDEIIDIMQNDVAAADTRTMGTGYHTDENYEAAAALKANKAFFIDEVTAWIANTYPTAVYDVAKCERDVGWFIDSVSWDVQHNSNAATVNNSRLYFDKAVSVLPENERPTTAASFEHMASLAGQIVRNELIVNLQQAVTTQTRANNTVYTPTNATYDPVTGISEITIGTHGYEVGDRVILAEESITFSCPDGANTVQISHPRATDPAFNTPITVLEVTSTSITLDVGNANGYTGAHTFVAADPNAVKTATVQPTYTPSNATYDPQTGISVLTIADHRFEAGDWIIMDEEAITFSCANTATQVVTNISHPRATDPYFNRPVEIIEVTGTTVKVQVGAVPNGYAGIHTFVSADADSIKKSAPPAIGAQVENLFNIITNMVRNNDFAELPAIKEPPLTGTGYNATINTYFKSIAGNTVKYQKEIIDFIRDEYNGLGYNTELCYRDVGLIVDAVCEDMEYGGDAATADAAQYYFKNAVSILPYEQRLPTRLAFEHLADVAEDVITNAVVTPTAGNTTPQITSGAAANGASALRAKTLVNIISDVVDNRLVIPGYAGSLDISVGQQTPEALPQATLATIPAIEPSRTFARKALQRNKEFIQDEVVAWINDAYFVYNEDKCARDVGYILDAVKRDIQTGSDYPSKYAGRAYRSGNVGTDIVLNEQLAETIEAIKYVRNDILPRLSGVALTRATSAFTNIINVMKDGTVGLTYSSYGSANIGSSYNSATDGLQLNKTFLAAELVAWINVQIAANATGFVGLVYDEAKCIRDVGYMVDAASYDIRHGSNVAMRDVARFYFEGGQSILPANQRFATAAAFTRIAAVAEQVVLKQAVAKSAGNALDPVTSGFGNVVGATAVVVENLFNIVSNLITAGDLIEMPAAIEADSDNGAATGYLYETDVAIVEGRKSTLAISVNDFLQETFDYLEYNQVKCRRDVGYMVDAISHDIQYGGNSAMWNAAQIYFVNAVNLLPKEQREPTRRAFTHMANTVQHVIRHETITRKFGRVYTPTNATYAPLTGVSIITLGAGHNLRVGDYIQLAKESLTFSCPTSDVDPTPINISHPRATDPAFNKPIRITAVTSTSVTINVGNAKGYDGVHTFVSAAKEAVKKVVGNTQVQYTNGLTARREIAQEAKDLALMVANIANDNNPTNLPARVEPHTAWMSNIFITEKDKVDDALETLVTSMINFISTEYKGISYPKEKCRRDVGIIIDALSHDVQYQTNYATRLVTNMYFDNAVSVLPFDQRNQTADFYEEMGNLLANVVIEGQAGQDVSNAPATVVEGDAIQDLVRMIEEAIRRDNLDALPELIEPNTSWVVADKVTAGEAIDSNLDQLADDVTTFIADNFTIIDYSKAKCRRDAGYIIDAMSYDLNYGGNIASKWNADFYFWNNQLRIPENTRVATAQAYRELGRIVSDVTIGKLAGQKLRPEMGAEAQYNQAYSLGMIFYNALFYNTPTKLGPTINPDFAWEESKQFSFAKDILSNNKRRLQGEVQRFITSEYKFIDLPKTYRDGGNLIKVLQNDFNGRVADPDIGLVGSDKASRSFVGALFNIDAQHVFPVFNPPATFTNWRKLRFKGTVENTTVRDALTGMKRWDSYIIPTNNATNRYVGTIYVWNGTGWDTVGANNSDLLEAFIGAWAQMKTYINTNIASDQTQRDMVTELIDNVIINSVIRPNFLVFGSLVESIAHQFNGASAGVNRNALPLNFRNVGAAIGANASVLSENGGRIRWSGSDELNNQYFARGLKINGRTGRIEGRPFTSSVRKLARRASNSRASL